jgi:hypothetical protein
MGKKRVAALEKVDADLFVPYNSILAAKLTSSLVPTFNTKSAETPSTKRSFQAARVRKSANALQ